MTPLYRWDASGGEYVNLRTGIHQEPGEDALYRPASYSTVADARAATGAPLDANYVVWDDEWTHLEQAFLALGANDILVLPEREEPYLIDSSNGFMAPSSSAAEVGDDVGPRIPITHSARNWFTMCRARRGVLGMGPGAVISPSVSGFTRPAQTNPLYPFPAGGGRGAAMVGVQDALMEGGHAHSFFANFRITGRDFGGVAYNGIVIRDRTTSTVNRIHFDGCWRGFDDEPNGETGGLAISKGTYLIEHCDFHSVDGPSPIMWNQNTGGVTRNVRTDAPNTGMVTFWRCGGLHEFENVWINGRQKGINFEGNDYTGLPEGTSRFQFEMTGGSIHLMDGYNGFHLHIYPIFGSQLIHLNGVSISPNGVVAGRTVAHNWLTSGSTLQKRSDITGENLTYPLVYAPSNLFTD